MARRRGRRWWFIAVGLWLFVTLCAVLPRAAGSIDTALASLTGQLHFSSDDVRAIDAGRAVTHTLDTGDGREVATLGAIRVAVPVWFYTDQLRTIDAFKGESSAVLNVGLFSNPARIEDLHGLSLDDRDFESLRKCRPGDCAMQLSADALARMRREVQWDSPNARATADRILREMLVDLVNGYRRTGDAALMTYADADEPVSVAAEFHSMVTSPPAVLEQFPDLRRHLLDFPRPSASGMDDVMYWSREKMGPATVVGVTHLAISRTGSGPAGAVAASRQIYSSHYFDASLGITILLDASSEGRAQTILVYVNRSRVDLLRGFFGGLKRGIMRSRTRSSVGHNLEETRAIVERRFTAWNANQR
jgi:hypothetical protein